MYTLNFRFRRKIYFLFNSKNNVKLIRLLFVFMCITLFFTAYLYGLIEITSKKLVIKISGSDSPEIISNIYDDTEFLKDVDPKRKLILNLKPNQRQKFNKKLLNVDSSSNSNSNGISYKNFEYNRQSDNLTGFFLKIERHNLLIKSNINQNDINLVENLRTKYQMKLAEKIRNKLKPPTLNNLEEEAGNINKNNNAKNDDDEEEDDERQTDDFASNEIITRETIIKILKYEKHLLKNKFNSNQIKTIKKLLMEYSENNEVEIDDLPAIWERYFYKISELHLNNDTSEVNSILHSMSTLPVITASEKEKGTQIKLLLLLEDGTDVLVKPMKTPRDYETPPDHFYFVDFERHHAEIAAYHVDKILGFNRVPPTVGRIFNMTHDLWEKAESELEKTFFYSPANNTCFTGHCSYYCDTTHATCGKPKDRMEGSVQLLLPSKPLVEWKITTHPFRRTYNKRKKAEWEVNENYCEEKLFQDGAYQSKLLLDIIDMSVFDFFTGNMDRHHFERMISLSNTTFSLHLDNGRSFGKSLHDELSILAPLKQCCLMRYSTYQRLKYLYKNNFASLLDESLKADPLYPILTSRHLEAVNRRMVIIFNELNNCFIDFKPNEVLIDDGY